MKHHLNHRTMYSRKHKIFCHLMETIYFFNPLAFKIDPMMILSILSTKESPLFHKGIIHAGLFRIIQSNKEQLDIAVNHAYDGLLSMIPDKENVNSIPFLNEMFTHMKNCVYCQNLKTIDYKDFTFGNGCKDRVKKQIIKNMSEFISKAHDYPMAVRVKNIDQIRRIFKKALEFSAKNTPFMSHLDFPKAIPIKKFIPLMTPYGSSDDILFVKKYVTDCKKSKYQVNENESMEREKEDSIRLLVTLPSDIEDDIDSPETDYSVIPVKRKKSSPLSSPRPKQLRKSSRRSSSLDTNQPSTSKNITSPLTKMRKVRSRVKCYKEIEESDSESSQSLSPVVRGKRNKGRVISKIGSINKINEDFSDVMIIDTSGEEGDISVVTQETCPPTPPTSEIASVDEGIHPIKNEERDSISLGDEGGSNEVDAASMESLSSQVIGDIDGKIKVEPIPLDLSRGRDDEKNSDLEVDLKGVVEQERVEPVVKVEVKEEMIEDIDEGPEISIIKKKVCQQNCKCCKPVIIIKDED